MNLFVYSRLKNKFKKNIVLLISVWVVQVEEMDAGGAAKGRMIKNNLVHLIMLVLNI